DSGAHFGLVGPQPHAMVAVAAENDSQSRAPRAGANDGNIAHACFSTCVGLGGILDLPNLCSVPFSRRRMLSLWRKMIRRLAITTSANDAGNKRQSSRNTQSRMGKLTVAAIDPRET